MGVGESLNCLARDTSSEQARGTTPTRLSEPRQLSGMLAVHCQKSKKATEFCTKTFQSGHENRGSTGKLGRGTTSGQIFLLPLPPRIQVIRPGAPALEFYLW